MITDYILNNDYLLIPIFIGMLFCFCFLPNMITAYGFAMYYTDDPFGQFQDDSESLLEKGDAMAKELKDDVLPSYIKSQYIVAFAIIIIVSVICVIYMIYLTRKPIIRY